MEMRLTHAHARQVVPNLPEAVLRVRKSMQSNASKKKNLIECPKCKRIMRTCCDIEASSSEDDHHLYVMSASDGYLPGLVKIGRSKNPAERACQLQEQMPFHIEIDCIYYGKGDHEKAVHEALEVFRVRSAPGKEWFELSKRQACEAIARVLFPE